MTDGSTGYIRIQDPGDPRDHGFADGAANPSNVGSNRRVFVGHNLADEGVLGTDTFLDTGITVSFRARIATSVTGIIDAQYPDTAVATPFGENNATPGGTAWQAGGNGELVHDGGKGNFHIRQATGDKIISFSLGLNTDTLQDGTSTFATTGLNMNSLNGTTPSGTVDPFQSEGTINALAVPV